MPSRANKDSLKNLGTPEMTYCKECCDFKRTNREAFGEGLKLCGRHYKIIRRAEQRKEAR